MADDDNARNRSNDSFGRGPAPAAPASDPLAELARLIGRNDPFAEYARESRAPVQPDAEAGYARTPPPPFGGLPPAPQYGSDPAPSYSTPAPDYREPAPQYRQEHLDHGPDAAQDHRQDYGQPAAPPRFAADYPPRYSDSQPARNDWQAPPSPAPSYPAADPFALPPQHPAPPLSALQYDNQGYAKPNYASPAYADPPSRAPMDGYPPERAGFNAAGYGAAPDRQGYAPPLYPHEPEAGSMPPPHDDEFYDDEPRGGRRKGLLTVVAVLALAVIGTAGAFGYRSIFGGSSSSGPPPVIRASGEPSKVAPPPATADTSVGKFSYDRFGDAGKDEQVVRREEKPVDLARAAPPRTVFPGAPAANSPAAKPPAAGTTAAANPPSAIGEPRRVRTVPIRPDPGDVAPSAQLPTTPPRVANSVASAQPPDDSAATRAAPPRANGRMASRPAQQAPAGNAPLSLSPDASSNALPPPPMDNFPPPPRAAAPPARVASAPATAPASAPASGGGGGGYLVQVSSQRSEADAQSAYRGIQSKYPGVLGNQPHTVRRADLGAKGVYYRAMVGPFPSREAAVQLCSSLKQAGGECVVQH